MASSKNDGFYLNSETTDTYKFEFVHVTLNYYTPKEILDALCKKVFKEDVNALLVVNNKPLSGTSVPTPQYLSRLGRLGKLDGCDGFLFSRRGEDEPRDLSQCNFLFHSQ